MSTITICNNEAIIPFIYFDYNTVVPPARHLSIFSVYFEKGTILLGCVSLALVRAIFSFYIKKHPYHVIDKDAFAYKK